MGYNIGIGNATIEYVKEDYYVELSVKGVEHEDAPNHCNTTGKGNYRYPSYSQWDEFCKLAGIHVLFYGVGRSRACPEGFHREYPLFFDHPGISVITEKDFVFVKAARIAREKINGGKEPGFFDQDPETHQLVDNGKDACLARLLWLEFWMRWALDNCEYPCIYNS